MKIALVEINDWHGECFLSHITYLENIRCEITLICHRKLKPLVEKLPIQPTKAIYLDFSKRKKCELNSKFQLWKYLYVNKFEKIIFNTAEKKAWKIIIPPYPKKTKLIGCVHNLDRFNTHLTQKLIGSALSEIFILSPHLLASVPQKLKHKTNIFYSIVYPKSTSKPKKNKNEIWVTIPGTIDYRRRDYNAILNLSLPKNTNIKIILLGKFSKGIKEETIQSFKQKDWIVTFDSYISDEEFNGYIQQSDYLLTLIHPNISFFNEYLNNKTSGTYNLAMGFNKTILIENSFRNKIPIENNFISYKIENFSETIENLQSLTNYKTDILHKVTNKYLKVINS